MDNSLRFGRFTSSQASRLCATLKSGLMAQSVFTYIDQVMYERIIGRSIDVSVNAPQLKWGKLMEVVLFNEIGLEYEMTHEKTLVHPKYLFWSGTPDLISKKQNKIGEIKSYYPNKFTALSLCILTKKIELLKEEFPSEYWQCVSNAILSGVDNAEILAFMPTKKTLLKYFKLIEETNFLEKNGLNPVDYIYYNEDNIENFPYLSETSRLNSINTFEFEVPKEDIDFLTDRIIMADNCIKDRLSNISKSINI